MASLKNASLARKSEVKKLLTPPNKPEGQCRNNHPVNPELGGKGSGVTEQRLIGSYTNNSS